MKGSTSTKIVVYQASNGAVEVKLDAGRETILLTQQQVAELFGVQKAAISKHASNIFDTGELNKQATVSILETVQTEGERTVTRKVEYYNLDLILSIGYRVNSTSATRFRQWATKTLRSHILEGYTLNKKVLSKNYADFMKAVEMVKHLVPTDSQFPVADAFELVKVFASTWFSLNAYDKSTLPKSGSTKQQVDFTAAELTLSLKKLKQNLLQKQEASEMFGQENNKDAIQGIIGDVMQSLYGKDVYETIEAKAAHLFYFLVKNHPFTDGNKRSGAFAFVWFLNKAKLLNRSKITPETLSALTLLIAKSNLEDKEQMIGLILLLLQK